MRYLTHQQTGRMLWLEPQENRRTIGDITNPQRLLALYKQQQKKGKYNASALYKVILVNYFITYSNEDYKKTKLFSIKMAKIYGKFDRVIGYSPEDIDNEFLKSHDDILSIPRGNGLWLWKPYFINKKLAEIDDNDILFYCDAGSYFLKSHKIITNTMKDCDVWISHIPLIEKQFTKPEVFHYLECNYAEYTDTNQIQANFVAVRKSEYSIKFIKTWLDACCDYNSMIMDTNLLEEVNKNKFLSHRCDQSMLSLISKKWGIRPHLDPTQFGRIPEGYYSEDRMFIIPEHAKEYPPTIILHRTANVNLRICFNQWVCAWLPITLIKRIKKIIKKNQ